MFNLLRGDASVLKAPGGAEEKEVSDTTTAGCEECSIFFEGLWQGADPSADSCKVCLVTESLL